MGKDKKSFTRYTVLTIVMVFVLVIIVSRLIYIQVVKSEDFKEQANKKAVTELEDFAPRGEILDSKGNVLVSNTQSYMLQYIETNECKQYYFDTIDQVNKILQENNETMKDDFELKVNPYRFEFKVQEDDPAKADTIKKILEIRFKKDRGYDEIIIYNLYDKKKAQDMIRNKDKISTEDNKKIDAALLKVTPKQMFDKLLKDYEIDKYVEIRYKKDQGYDDIIIKKLFPKKAQEMILNKDKISTEDNSKIDKALLEMAPKQVAYKLLKDYEINKNAEITKGRKFTPEELRRYIMVRDAAKIQSYSGFRPVIVASNISKEAAFIFLQKLNDLPGMDVSTQPSRVYPFKDLGSNFIGYISKVQADSQGKKDSYGERGYNVNTDYIGASGLESALENKLKGSKGARIVKLNKDGRIIEELGRREPYPGQNVQLTISKDVQNAADKALEAVLLDRQAAAPVKDVHTDNATRGAVIVRDVNTGGIIAMSSKPSFDPNMMVQPGGLSPDLYKKYFSPDLGSFGRDYIIKRGLQVFYPGKSVDDVVNIIFPIDKSIQGNSTIRSDPYDIYPKPFFNYATQSIIPPGSTFKPLTAIAGLETGVIDVNTTVNDPGYYTYANGTKVEFPADGPNGVVNLTSAIGVSSNPYFMTVGKKLRDAFKTDDILAQYAWKFGLGNDPSSSAKKGSGIEIAEKSGQVYNTQTKKDIISQQCVWEIMSNLKAGKNSTGSTFASIDLYTKDDDDSEVKALKSNFKSEIKNQVKNAQYNNKKNEEILRQLISADSLYKDKKISDKDIKIIIETIHISEAVSIDTLSFKYEYNMNNAVIGQGDDNFSPLELVNYISTIVNGGNRYKVHLVDKYIGPDGKVIEEVKPTIIENTGIKPSTVEAVKKGMQAVTKGDGGTARAAFEGFPISNAGKTGSATYSNEQNAYGRTSYAEYVGFAPYDNPQIAVVVVVFDGGYGGNVAKVARAVYEEYFKDVLKKDYPNYTPTYDYNTNP